MRLLTILLSARGDYVVRLALLLRLDLSLRFHKLREEFDVLLAPVLLVVMSDHDALLLFLGLANVPLDLVRDIEEVKLGDLLEELHV
jgi:hypothetical protein